MIGYQHQITGAEVQIHAAGGIGKNQRTNAQSSQYPDRQGQLLLGEPFIVVQSALQGNYLAPLLFAENKGTGVTFHGGLGEVGNLRIGNPDGICQCVGKVSQTAAQHQCDLRGERNTAAEKLCRV